MENWTRGTADTKQGSDPLPSAANTVCCGSGDEPRDGSKGGRGCGGWELPLPCGTSDYLHRHLSVSMQVLQIVKELVSPSRHRAAARFGGVCSFRNLLSCHHSHWLGLTFWLKLALSTKSNYILGGKSYKTILGGVRPIWGILVSSCSPGYTAASLGLPCCQELWIHAEPLH